MNVYRQTARRYVSGSMAKRTVCAWWTYGTDKRKREGGSLGFCHIFWICFVWFFSLFIVFQHWLSLGVLGYSVSFLCVVCCYWWLMAIFLFLLLTFSPVTSKCLSGWIRFASCSMPFSTLYPCPACVRSPQIPSHTNTCPYTQNGRCRESRIYRISKQAAKHTTQLLVYIERQMRAMTLHLTCLTQPVC